MAVASNMPNRIEDSLTGHHSPESARLKMEDGGDHLFLAWRTRFAEEYGKKETQNHAIRKGPRHSISAPKPSRISAIRLHEMPGKATFTGSMSDLTGPLQLKDDVYECISSFPCPLQPAAAKL